MRKEKSEFLTVGEAAKKMGVSVRTLQYYDKKGILPPSCQSEGGRRLYSYQDIIKLHQILSLKYLGFSLDEIKNSLISLNTPADVEAMLCEQAKLIRKKIAELSKALDAIEKLKEEVMQIETVDFKKYADIIVNLQMGNEYYWAIKYFDDSNFDLIRDRFDKDSAMKFMKDFKGIWQRAARLRNEGILPQSEQGRAIAEEFWKLLMEFSNGDMSIFSQMQQLVQHNKNADAEWRDANTFIELALGSYFSDSKKTI